MFSIEINFAFRKLLFYNLFPSDRYAFLCKITVLAFLGMQLWSINSIKNLKKEHRYFSRCYYITPEIKLLHQNGCKFLLTSNTSLLLSLLCLGSWRHRVSLFFLSQCVSKACNICRVVPASGTLQEPKGGSGGQLQVFFICKPQI